MAEPLSPQQQRALRRLAGMMIPASVTYRVPSADDDAIFDDILRSFGPDGDHVVAVLDDLDRRAGGAFADLPDDAAHRVAEQARTAGGTSLMMTCRIILQCYYRDDRVMTSLRMEPRPPFPKGFEIEQGDWTLLEPVRRRGRLWRDDA